MRTYLDEIVNEMHRRSDCPKSVMQENMNDGPFEVSDRDVSGFSSKDTMTNKYAFTVYESDVLLFVLEKLLSSQQLRSAAPEVQEAVMSITRKLRHEEG